MLAGYRTLPQTAVGPAGPGSDDFMVCITRGDTQLESIARRQGRDIGSPCVVGDGSGAGRVWRVPEEQFRSIQAIQRDIETEERVVVLDEIQIGGRTGQSDRRTTTRTPTQTVTETVTKGMEDAYAFFSGKTTQQPSTSQPPTPGDTLPPDLVVSQASIMPGGPWPWVIGGSLLLVVGGTAFANWYLGRDK